MTQGTLKRHCRKSHVCVLRDLMPRNNIIHILGKFNKVQLSRRKVLTKNCQPACNRWQYHGPQRPRGGIWPYIRNYTVRGVERSSHRIQTIYRYHLNTNALSRARIACQRSISAIVSHAHGARVK
ncbi:hypothetical protein MT325_m065L [Paramecium bursaria chlorella virus MT325]|uniref:Uncharacterized protein m065L n=1 Tax=Paramecium bursaria Chlorella virus MT325 TaxID=346932 RepID=A7ITE5_PBCVM|nr:hypothetical protein MT325_m065L [Paramecium bursaria chlorella virus MT325]